MAVDVCSSRHGRNLLISQPDLSMPYLPIFQRLRWRQRSHHRRRKHGAEQQSGCSCRQLPWRYDAAIFSYVTSRWRQTSTLSGAETSSSSSTSSSSKSSPCRRVVNASRSKQAAAAATSHSLFARCRFYCCHWQPNDISWQQVTELQITKYIAISFLFQLFYLFFSIIYCNAMQRIISSV